MTIHGIMDTQRPSGAETPPAVVNIWIGDADVSESTCKFTECEREVHGRGWCLPHYKQWRKSGEVRPLRVAQPAQGLTCSVAECVHPVKGRGLCGAHYFRWRTKGDVEAHIPVGVIAPGLRRRCAADGCEQVQRRTMCDLHRSRMQTRGTTEERSVSERFWAKVDKTETCWLWTGKTRYGYGQHCYSIDKMRLAHRFAYEELVGPIPEGLELDHLCYVRNCVNPAHLEPVTGQENRRRAKVHRHLNEVL